MQQTMRMNRFFKGKRVLKGLCFRSRAKLTLSMSLASRIDQDLKDSGSQVKKAWWEKYLKNELQFYGVPMERIRVIAQKHWDSADPSGIDSILELFRIPFAEPKLAAILLLQTRYPPLSIEELKKLGTLFDDKYISDWHITDWFCTKVLAKYVEDASIYAYVRTWTQGSTVWKRRCPVVMLVPCASKVSIERAKEFLEIAEESLGRERFAQTGVAWLLAEISKKHSGLVVDFVNKHKDVLIREAHDRALKHIKQKKRKS
jgi:3-methyladenine DNA glycosylase AlkD